ncbi:MFS transporter [Iodidimonas gelatinilytica]|nr:MFS transporter [Iodidimonas gelatinilytica]
MTYLQFIYRHPKRLGLGFGLTLFGSFGQTYFISLFGKEFRMAFDLSVAGFGTVYSLATLLSGFSVLYFGALIDRFSLPVYLTGVISAFALATLGLGLLPLRSVIFLFVVIYLLRLCGQGLMTHASSTTMARDFTKDRGKAISFASMGHAAGEAVFPVLAVAMMLALGWRTVWLGVGLMLLLMLPLLLWLAHSRNSEGAMMDPAGRAGTAKDWTRSQVLRDPAFYLLLVAMVAPPFINTGFFFHQVPLVEAKDWTRPLFASAFGSYAVATVVGILVAGRLVDRLGARRVLIFAMLPYALGLVLAGSFDQPVVAHFFMAMAGISTGLFYPCATAVWAELYGLRHLGAIRALTSGMMVFSTSLAPALMGWLLDGGVGFSALFFGCALWAVLTVPAVLASNAISGTRRLA